MAPDTAGAGSVAAQIAANRARQSELYGAPLGDRVRRLTGALGVSQARLARVLGMSPAMLSQLVSARRVKIGDPAVLARMLVLDQRLRAQGRPRTPQAVDALLADVSRTEWRWTAQRAPVQRRPVQHGTAQGRAASAAAVALRRIADPQRLAAAAAALGPAFPELAEVLRRAAGG